MMTLSKGKAAVAILAAVVFLGTVVVFTLDDARGQSLPAARATEADLRQKAQARVEAAERVLAALEIRVRGGESLTLAFLDLQAGWVRRLAEARIDATDDSAARMRAAEQYVQQCRDMLAMLERREVRDVTTVQVAQAEYHLADAEYLLAKMQGR